MSFALPAVLGHCCIFFIDWFSFVNAFYFLYLNNFQHWMSWLGWWWRVQQNVISMLNSRISWINRNLNAHCAFGVFLKTYLLQRLFSNINKPLWFSHVWWLLHVLCVTADMLLTHAVHTSLFACHSHVIEGHSNLLLHAVFDKLVVCMHCLFASLFETWTQASKPAEFKHISRRWMRNSQGFL